MVFGIKSQKKIEKKQSLIDGKEAFNLWDILRSKYVVLEKLMIWQRCAHDKDLQLLAAQLQKSIKENVEILEKLMEKYAVKAPDQNKTGISHPGSSQMITDEFISQDIFIYLQEHIENLLTAFMTSFTNDSVREVFKNMAIKTIDHTNKMMKYLKLKGWIETPPLYQHVDPNVSERLTTVEATSLWDHLTLRYDNRRLTELYLTYAHDADFKVSMEMGLKTLNKQIDNLERELLHFGIPMPKKPSKITMKDSTSEFIWDDHMYRTLLMGLRTVATLHARTYKEVTYNDRIRGIFQQIMNDEMAYVDMYLKYGKLKGWLHTIPKYGPY